MDKKILSIFIDESGDFGKYESHNPYYIVSMVIHDQNYDINEAIDGFNKHITNLGFNNNAIHSAPLIRRDVEEYSNIPREERRKLFVSIFMFAQKLPINYISTTIKKDINDDEVSISSKISKGIISTLKNHYSYLNKYEKIIIYYDNGQIQLTKIIVALFTALFNDVEYRKVRPVEYKLFQIADLICTLELINEKTHSIGLSKSELDFFESAHKFKKDYYKKLLHKKLINK